VVENNIPFVRDFDNQSIICSTLLIILQTFHCILDMARSPVRPRKANADSNPDAKTLISPSDEPITDGEIETCLSMERKIVGRVEILEPDNGRTVYFLVSGKNDLKSSTW
jgi:hypothetical protein